MARAPRVIIEPNIVYATVVSVDETDATALDPAWQDAGQACRGFCPYIDDEAEGKKAQANFHP